MSRRHISIDKKPSSSLNQTSSRDSRHSRPTLRDATGARETHAGEEPGINLRRRKQKDRHIKQDCTIEVVEYSQDSVNLKLMGNSEFIELMKDPSFQPMHANIPNSSPASTMASGSSSQTLEHEEIHEHPKVPAVRWINIGGLDWDVISAVGMKYDLHALALEDVLHEQGHSQSKADYYNEHLFIRVVCHTLEQEDSDDPNSALEETLTSTAVPHKDEGELNRGPCALSPIPSEDSALERGQLAREKGYANDSSSLLEMKDGASDIVESRRKRILKFPKRYLKRRITGLTGFLAPAKEKQMLRIKALTKGDRVNVRHEPMSIFLFRDGTVITIHPHPTLEFTNPITERLHDPDSLLRTSEDASLLIESLLDLVVDRILEIMDEYQDKIHKLEHDVLLKPNMSSVRSLHILSGDLILHKRTLDPIKTMIWGLRRYDLDRCIALVDNMEAEADRVEALGNRGKAQKHTKERALKHHEDDEGLMHLVPGSTGGMAGAGASRVGLASFGAGTSAAQAGKVGKKAVGYLSYKTKVYLADVYDHIDFVLASLEMFSGLAENLINFAFNMSSNEMNQVMARLTLVTIIFLPLTLLTGYFGMNFEHFSAISNSDFLFWKIAFPVMGVLIPLFMYSDIFRLMRYIRKVWATRQTVRQHGYRH